MNDIAPPSPPPREHTIVCGLGHVGFRVSLLLRRLGEDVTVICKAPRGDWVESARAAGIKVHVGDARDLRRLEEAGLARASAVLALTDDDGTNLEIALDARKARPDVRIVARLFDPHLANSAASAFRIDSAFAMALLAAPVFAAAALEGTVHTSFVLRGVTYLFGEVDLGDDSPLVGLSPADLPRSYGAVLVRRTRNGRAVSSEGPFEVGEHLGLLAGARSFEELGGQLRVDAKSRRRPPSSWASARAMAKRAWTGSPVVLRVTVLALVLISLVSILVFERTLGLRFSEAVYFVTTTLTTTGYGDITVRDHGPVMHLYASVLMLLGSTTMAVMFAFVTDFFVRERFRELSGKPEMPDAPHVIVAGLGDVGLRVAETFERSGPDAVVMEREPGPYTIDVQGRMPLVTGDARLGGLLDRAAVAKAVGLVAVTGSDAVNVAICLAARERNPRLRTICRIFDPGFASKLEASGTIDRALSASRIASPTFAASAVQKDVRAATVLRDALLVFSEVAVEDDAFRLRPGWTPLLRARGASPFVPFVPSEPLRAGDRLLVQSTSAWVDADGADGALEPPSHPAP